VMQVARLTYANAIKITVERLPKPAQATVAIHGESPNQTYKEYKQVCELITETNTLILGWKRKRKNKSDIAYVPEAVEVATPSKFLRLSQAGRDELEIPVNPLTMLQLRSHSASRAHALTNHAIMTCCPCLHVGRCSVVKDSVSARLWRCNCDVKQYHLMPNCLSCVQGHH
jgi:hypothetical protein